MIYDPGKKGNNVLLYIHIHLITTQLKTRTTTNSSNIYLSYPFLFSPPSTSCCSTSKWRSRPVRWPKWHCVRVPRWKSARPCQRHSRLSSGRRSTTTNRNKELLHSGAKYRWRDNTKPKHQTLKPQAMVIFREGSWLWSWRSCLAVAFFLFVLGGLKECNCKCRTFDGTSTSYFRRDHLSLTRSGQRWLVPYGTNEAALSKKGANSQWTNIQPQNHKTIWLRTWNNSNDKKLQRRLREIVWEFVWSTLGIAWMPKPLMPLSSKTSRLAMSKGSKWSGQIIEVHQSLVTSLERNIWPWELIWNDWEVLKPIWWRNYLYRPKVNI